MLTCSSMDDSVFKVPKLPGDNIRRKANSSIRSENGSENLDFRRERENTSQALGASHFPGAIRHPQSNWFDRCIAVENDRQLRPIRESVREEFAQASTSQCRQLLQTNRSKSGIFPNSFDRYGLGAFSDNCCNDRRYNCVNSTVEDNMHNSVFNSVNLPRNVQSGLGGRMHRSGLSCSSLINHPHNSTTTLSLRNLINEKTDTYREMHSSNSLGIRKPNYATGTFHNMYRVQRGCNINERRCQSNHGSNTFHYMHRTSAPHKDPHFSLSSIENVTNNQLLLNSIGQVYLASMKEKIINTVEDFGHSVLRNVPEMVEPFSETVKKISSIIDYTVCDLGLSTVGLSSLSNTSGIIGCPKQRLSSFVQEGTNKEQCETFKKPCSILGSISTMGNKSSKCNFIKSFKVEKKNEKNLNCGDVSFESDASMSTQLETSLNATVKRRSMRNLLKISNQRNRKGRGKENYTSPKGKKTNVESTENREEKGESKGKKSKVESNVRKRSCTPMEKSPVKLQKRDSTKGARVEKLKKNDEEAQKSLITTRSGRVVKPPQDIFSDTLKDGTAAVKDMPKTIIKSKKVGKKNNKQSKGNKSAKIGKQEEKRETMMNNGTIEQLKPESPVSTSTRRNVTKKVTSKPVRNVKSQSDGNDNSWGNEMNGLDDICLPDISIRREEKKSEAKKLKLSTMETPPLRNLRNNLTFLENYSPIQSPDWQVSRHTRSAVKKFEKIRAQTFRTRIAKESSKKRDEKVKNTIRSNKDIETVVNWINDREVRSPKKCSDLISYLLPKRKELEDEDEDIGD